MKFIAPKESRAPITREGLKVVGGFIDTDGDYNIFVRDAIMVRDRRIICLGGTVATTPFVRSETEADMPLDRIREYLPNDLPFTVTT